ncbi:formylglycine-generating enzyme family protein [Sphingobacterium alkalisoli]|uniref:Formylglycine-generating enzyme family protein n=1 Tax=Sphingobacterium alkalisoli TaxID=1874115 RepID=A0A4U0HAT6_9SPHI|nr:SUMF1/EgtB/PvdO family nonheme iron enzyme [Sphingobacterium alkalisoli]TJY68504.1 formylglycine-generating enzyme family protein [Sphingobacterium alkalisoli]GGH06023.1 hypothetical protein GCM10011418_02520 [Sphingobacterium alkalisoli]
MKKYLIILLTLLICSYTRAQSTVAKFKYEDAEKAFYNGDYQSCISLLDETEKLLGKSAPNILYLRILAESKILEVDPYTKYEQIEKLRSLCSQYLQNYDIAGLEGKYRDVYELSGKLPKAANQTQLTQLGEAEHAKQLERIIAENNLVFVEGGTFMMGEKKGTHQVSLSDFYICKYEVTVAQYHAFCDATGRSMPQEPSWGWSDIYPVVNINHHDAVDYCQWLSETKGGNWRLPTEAEWEYAARGGKHSRGYTYSGGNRRKEVAWHNGNSKVRTHFMAHPVGKRKPNELGIYDMSGNAEEWCHDWYREDYYTNSPDKNPKGPNSGSGRVVRGGNWRYSTAECKVSYRYSRIPETTEYYSDIRGFRVVFSQ